MTGKPFLLGLTGSIGMGKSTTAAMFADAGVPVWDADAAVHRLYAAGGAAVQPMFDLRPDAIAEGAVCRAALKAWISEDPSALKQIETIVHPLVARDRADFIAEHADAPLIVLDIPLLYETGSAANFDAVAVVTTNADEQRRRVLARGTMSEAQFETILAKQLPDAEKRARADYIIATDTLDTARTAVKQIIEKIKGS